MVLRQRYKESQSTKNEKILLNQQKGFFYSNQTHKFLTTTLSFFLPNYPYSYYHKQNFFKN
ncbi:MAG: hypothetical protein ACK4J0_03640, partial [Candidatus Anstonellaceae archaeon]